MLPSFLVCWTNLDQFLLRQSFVNHPAMTVKCGNFYSRSRGNIPRYFESKCDVLYFFVILNYNAKLTTEWQVINHRHKILQQCYSNTDFLSDNFLLEKSKELLKINLVFRACLLAESFFTKIEQTMTICFELNYSHKGLKKNTYRRVHRNNAGYYQNRNPSHIFL